MTSDRDRFDASYQHYLHLSNMQVQGETVYASRTAVITLAQGLLLVVAQALIGGDAGRLPGVLLGALGALLSLSWFFFEQRNQIYFRGRGAVLEQAELDMQAAAAGIGVSLTDFWRAVPIWVETNAKWYEQSSAPRILRGVLPIMFVCLWVLVFFVSLQHQETDAEFNIDCRTTGGGGTSCKIE